LNSALGSRRFAIAGLLARGPTTLTYSTVQFSGSTILRAVGQVSGRHRDRVRRRLGGAELLERGGMTSRSYRIRAGGKTLSLSTVVAPDGRIAQYLIAVVPATR
jgi:hypothetical protein